MTDTNKCPECGKPMHWSEWSVPAFGWCEDEGCGYRTPEKSSEVFNLFSAPLARIRELETRIAELEAELARAEKLVWANRLRKWRAEN
jgi:uncharacterized small protein (DUF1192 family)